MRSSPDTCRFGYAALAFILGLNLASCEGGGPAGPPAPTFALSSTSLVFAGPAQETQVTISNLRSKPLSWRVLASTASWLTAAPVTGSIDPGGNGTLTVRINRSAVPQGTHSATLQIGAEDYSAPINVSVNEASIARAVLAPSSITLGPQETQQTIVVSNAGTGSLNWSLTAPSWVSLDPKQGTLTSGSQINVTIARQSEGLTAGQYTGAVQMTSNGGSPSASLSLAVPSTSGLRLEPTALDFATSATTLNLRVVNPTDHAIQWNAELGGPWIELSSATGSLPPHLSQLLTVRVSRSGLSHGINQAPILFETDAGSTVLTVSAMITPAGGGPILPPGGPRIAIAPVFLDFGESMTELTVRLFNDGDSPLDWTASSDSSWLSLPIAAGRVSPHSNWPVAVRVNRGHLPPGTHRGTIQFESAAGAVSATVSVTVPTSPTPPPPLPTPKPAKLAITPTGLDFGAAATELPLQIQNTGGSMLSWNATTTNGWISVTPASGSLAPGATQAVAVRSTRVGMTAGTYQSSVQFSSNGGAATIGASLQVTATPPPPPPPPSPAKLVATPTGLDFGLAGTELTIQVKNSGGSTLTWNAATANGWLSLTPASGSVVPGATQAVAVRSTRVGLTTGTYQGTIQLASNGGSATIGVSLQVSPPPPPPPANLVVTPGGLDFGSSGTELTLQVQNTGGSTLSWNAVTANGWLSVIPASGSVAPGAIQTIQARSTRVGLTAGTYSSTIQIASNGGNALIGASLQVAPPPAAKLTVTPTSLDFGLTGTELALQVKNTGGSTLSWSAATANGWLSVTPVSGSLAPGAIQVVSAQATRAGLTAGTYSNTIQFTSNGGNATIGVSLQAALAPPPGGSNLNVVDFGARGDDLTDDSPAFRRALSSLPSTGGVLTIPAGTYYLRPIVGIDNIDSGLELLSRTNVTIAGAGMDQTILRMVAAPYSGDTHIVVLDRVQQVTLRDLTLDGNVPAASYSDEQSHGVEVRSGSNIRFENVRIMRTHGDGIRLLGLAKSSYSWVDQILVVDCRFESTGRSGIGVQRGVKGVTITGSIFTKVADQAVSMEPSSTIPNSAPRDVVVSNNRFFNMSPIAIAVVGLSEVDPARNVHLTGNTLEQTTIMVYNGDDIHIENNALYGSNRSPIRIQRASRNIWIVGNLINDEAAFHGESSVVLAYDSPFAPTDVHFVGNTVRSGRFTGFYARDSQRLQITGNVFIGTGPAGVFVGDVMEGSPLANFYVGQNQITGYSSGVRFHSRGDLLSQACSEDNTITNYLQLLQVSGPVSLSC